MLMRIQEFEGDCLFMDSRLVVTDFRVNSILGLVVDELVNDI